ncbi:MAG: replication initiator protein A [Lachnospiraceae bacterium]
MLYGLLLDRMHLSAKNGWTDKCGRVYHSLPSKRRRKSCASGTKRYADCSRN